MQALVYTLLDLLFLLYFVSMDTPDNTLSIECHIKREISVISLFTDYVSFTLVPT